MSSTVTKPALFPLRQRTGTAAFHLSKEAVDVGLEDLAKLTARQTVGLVARIRWGSEREMPCPHCGTFDEHYFVVPDYLFQPAAIGYEGRPA